MMSASFASARSIADSTGSQSTRNIVLGRIRPADFCKYTAVSKLIVDIRQQLAYIAACDREL